jgi:ribosomal-protein-alanine N-acetyltransferase
VRPAVFLRRARASDVPALAKLEADCFTHPWTERQVADEVRGAAPGLVLVLEGPRGPSDPDAIRAYGSFRLVLDEAHVMNVAVAPPHRRQGLARWLLAFAMGRLWREGAERCLLEVRAGNAEALALYESLGFRRTGVRRGYYREPAEDALALGRDRLDEFSRHRPRSEP